MARGMDGFEPVREVADKTIPRTRSQDFQSLYAPRPNALLVVRVVEAQPCNGVRRHILGADVPG